MLIKFLTTFLTRTRLGKNTLLITYDFNHPHNHSIKLSSGLYAGKNISCSKKVTHIARDIGVSKDTVR